MKNNKIQILILALIIMIPFSASALEIEYLGSFEDNLFAASSITVDNNSLTVLEPFSKEIKVFTPNGLLQQKLHIKGDVNSISKLSQNEYLYCDLDAHIVAYVDLNKDSQTDYFENVYSFMNPIDIIVHNTISILDSDAKQIVIFSKQKEISAIISLKKNDGTTISFPNSFAQNKVNGNYYVLDQLASEIWIFNQAGAFIKSFSTFGAGLGEITRGGEISIATNGLVYISDRYQNRVSIFSEEGQYLEMIPNKNLQVKFNIPTGITIDENNVLYVASTENSRIQMFHIASSSTTADAISMEQLRPLPYDTVQTSEIEFIASATTDLSIQIDAFDFEIYTSDDSTNTISSHYDVVPTHLIDSLQNKSIYSAEWVTSEELTTLSSYQWRTRIHTQDSVYAWSEFLMFTTSGLPISYSLAQNYPNPFNPTTTIDFSLAKDSDVMLEVFNLNGQKVITLIDKSLSAGSHSVNWAGNNTNGQKSATGIYFYKLTADQFVQTKKMVLLK